MNQILSLSAEGSSHRVTRMLRERNSRGDPCVPEKIPDHHQHVPQSYLCVLLLQESLEGKRSVKICNKSVGTTGLSALTFSPRP